MDDETMSPASSTVSAVTSTMTASAPEFIPKRNLNGAASTKKRQPLANPSMVPQQPRIPKTAAEKETTRRLYIVLSQACLETYQVSGGGASGAARRDGRYEPGREERYTLLNCDDHVGAPRDSASMATVEANSKFWDIAFAARNLEQDEQRSGYCASGHYASGEQGAIMAEKANQAEAAFRRIVSSDVAGLAAEQGWLATSVYPNGKRRLDRGQPKRTDTANVQAICRSYG